MNRQSACRWRAVPGVLARRVAMAFDPAFRLVGRRSGCGLAHRMAFYCQILLRRHPSRQRPGLCLRLVKQRRVEVRFCRKRLARSLSDEHDRYTYFTLGALMLFLALIRVVILPMQESPKFLMSIGKDEEAVAVVQKIAKMNGRTTTLTVERLRQAAAPWADGSPDAATTKFSVMERIKHSMSDLRGEHIRAIFSTRRLAFSSSLIILIYGLLGE